MRTFWMGLGMAGSREVRGCFFEVDRGYGFFAYKSGAFPVPGQGRMRNFRLSGQHEIKIYRCLHVNIFL